MTALAYAQVPRVRTLTGLGKPGKVLLFPKVKQAEVPVAESRRGLSGAGAALSVSMLEVVAPWEKGISNLDISVDSNCDFVAGQVGVELAAKSFSAVGQARVVPVSVSSGKVISQPGVFALLLIGLYQACLSGLFENNVNRSWHWTARGKAIIFGIWLVLGLLGVTLFALRFFSVSNAPLMPGEPGLWNTILSYFG